MPTTKKKAAAVEAHGTAGPEATIPPLNIQEGTLTLVGDSSLICHQWSEKAKSEMRDKQQKKAKQARDAKDPDKEFKGSLYPMPGGNSYGFPAVAFKTAAVDACSHVANITKVEARGAFHVKGELIELKGDPTPREDMVRIGMGTADLRYRGEFKEWSATVVVRYNASVLSWSQIVHLFNVAGFAIGVGEWRPQKDGSHGMFHVDEKAA